jgi:uncharacterized protein (DUF952 family)
MIYHVTTISAWEACAHENSYAPKAFEKEGFIHSCHLHQLSGVLGRYFLGQEDLLLLHIDEQKLVSQVRHEPGTGNELFPHIYGTINKDAIKELTKGRDNFPVKALLS